MKTTRSFTSVTALLLLPSLPFLSACSSKNEDSPEPQTSEPAKGAAAGGAADPTTGEGAAPVSRLPDAPLTPAMREAFGAAALVPADAGYFSTTLRLAEQWEAFVQSRAMKSILELPGVQVALQQLLRSPPYVEFQRRLEADPLFARTFELLSDAVSQEIFLYGDAKVSEFLDALLSVYTAGLLPDPNTAGAGQPGVPLANALRTVIEFESKLRLPGLVIGCRLSKPEAAGSVLADLVEGLRGALPGPIVSQRIGEGRYHTVMLSARVIPRPVRAELATGLRREGVPDDLVTRLDAVIDRQNLTLTVGVRGKYLVLSLGADNEHLRRLGESPSLAESPALKPVRRHFKPDLLSLVYVSKDLPPAGKLRRDEILAWLDAFLKGAPPDRVPEGAGDRLKNDAAKLIDEVNRLIPDPSPTVAVSFLNRGVESFAFTAREVSNVDASKPLTLLRRSGGAPLVAVASRGVRSKGEYEILSRWLGVGRDYFEELVLPRMPQRDVAEYRRFRDVFLPALRELDETTRTLLIPAVDGFQSLLVVDGDGRFQGPPGSPATLAEPLRVPRPAILLEVNDSEELKQAFSRYRETANRFIRNAARTDIGLRPFEIPEPETRPFAGGTLYTYKLPTDIGGGFEPHALIAGNLVVLSLFPEQSRSLLETDAWLTSEVVDLSAPSGKAYRIDLRRLFGLVVDDAGIVLRAMASGDEIRPELAAWVSVHLPAIGQALGALRSFSGKVYTEGEHQVHHSWLEVVDLEGE